MSARSVGAVVRARAAASRRVGAGQIPSLAAGPTLEEALTRLAPGPYGARARPGQHLDRAQHEVAATFLWNLRVLAGWTGPDGQSGMPNTGGRRANTSSQRGRPSVTDTQGTFFPCFLPLPGENS